MRAPIQVEASSIQSICGSHLFAGSTRSVSPRTNLGFDYFFQPIAYFNLVKAFFNWVTPFTGSD